MNAKRPIKRSMMVRISAIALLGAFTQFFGPPYFGASLLPFAFAQPNQNPPEASANGKNAGNKSVREQSDRIEIGFRYSDRDYKEEVSPPLKSTESGTLPGVHIGYEAPPDKNGWAHDLSLDLDFGNTDFDGTTQSGQPVEDQTENLFLVGEYQLGYALADQPLILLVGGVGGFYWKRELGGMRPFTEHYRYLFLPFGVEIAYSPSDRFTFGVEATLRYLVTGRIEVKLSEADPALEDSTGTLGDELGYKIEVPLRYDLSPRWGVGLSLWYQYAPIGRGDDFVIRAQNGMLLGAGVEPASTNRIFGFTLLTHLYL